MYTFIMKIAIRENALLWTVLIFFALIGILFYYTSRRVFENQEFAQDQIPSQSPSSSLLPTPLPSKPASNAVHVIEDTGEHSTTHYQNKIFIPHTIRITRETGCFVAIENKSNEDVIPRLGPYDAKNERGFLYSPIHPATTGLIDPRYATFAVLSFYNKNRPEASFVVDIDPSCYK